MVVGLAAGGVAQIGRASGSYRATVDLGYSALASPLARVSNTSGADLRTALASAPTLERVTLFTTLDALVAAVGREQRSLDALTPPAPTSGTAPCRQAFAGRAAGVRDVRDGLESVLGGHSGSAPADLTAAESMLASAGTGLADADASWVECRRHLRAAPGHARLVVSRWVTTPGLWAPAALTRLVSAVARAPHLAAHPALTVDALTTEPAALAAGSGGLVAPTTTVTVHAVVVNQGNVDEPAVQVRVTLVPVAAPSTAATETAIVAVAAGRAVAVVLGPFSVQPGTTYTMQVNAAPPQGPGGTSTTAPLQVEAVPTTTTTTTVPSTTTTAPGRHTATTLRG